MNENYQIIRPRLHLDFELPARNELLDLKPGDSVKLMFQVAGSDVERIWVTLTDTSAGDTWFGVIDNDAVQDAVARVISAGELVKFHPLDIIAIY